MNRPHGRAGRPYPNVQAYRKVDGTLTYQANLPYVDHRGRKNSTSVGHYSTPEEARKAVLIAQAERLEAKAADYRAEAAKMVTGPSVVVA